MTKMRTRGKSLTKRAKLNLKIKKYKYLNKKYNKYKPMSYDLSNFSKNDVPVVGDRLEKKRANSRNYRQRMSLMKKVLNERINAMENLSIGMPGPIHLCEFQPLLNFTEKDEDEIRAQGLTFDIHMFEQVNIPAYT